MISHLFHAFSYFFEFTNFKSFVHRRLPIILSIHSWSKAHFIGEHISGNLVSTPPASLQIFCYVLLYPLLRLIRFVQVLQVLQGIHRFINISWFTFILFLLIIANSLILCQFIYQLLFLTVNSVVIEVVNKLEFRHAFVERKAVEEWLISIKFCRRKCMELRFRLLHTTELDLLGKDELYILLIIFRAGVHREQDAGVEPFKHVLITVITQGVLKVK